MEVSSIDCTVGGRPSVLSVWTRVVSSPLGCSLLRCVAFVLHEPLRPCCSLTLSASRSDTVSHAWHRPHSLQWLGVILVGRMTEPLVGRSMMAKQTKYLGTMLTVLRPKIMVQLEIAAVAGTRSVTRTLMALGLLLLAYVRQDLGHPTFLHHRSCCRQHVLHVD